MAVAIGIGGGMSREGDQGVDCGVIWSSDDRSNGDEEKRDKLKRVHGWE